MKKAPYIHRDISWMHFNYRVLQEAMRSSGNPLLERLKFLAIYSNNLSEFFKVRVAHHKNLYRLKKKQKQELQIESKKIIKQILKMVHEQQLEFSNIFENQIVPELNQNGINIRKRGDLDERQLQFVHDYFRDHLLPYVQPILLLDNKIKPFLNSAALYLALELTDKDSSDLRYALVQIPSDKIDRIIVLPEINPEVYEVIFLDDIVRENISDIFPGFEIKNSFSIKLTRDADLYIDDEFSGDLIDKLKVSLKKRKVGPPSRLVYDRDMPEAFLQYLMNVFELDDLDIISEGSYHNNFDLFKFPDFGKDYLKQEQLTPLPYTPLENCDNIYDEIEREDHIINVPFHSYESVIKFFEDAAIDRYVTEIKIVQYRVAGKSRIMNALKLAVKKGKKVSAFIELKARFDEEANLKWVKELRSAGVKVYTSFPGIKVHCKVALVIRKVEGEVKKYTYLSSGNFHEGTAKLYSDFGLFTYDKRLTKDAVHVLEYLEREIKPESGFQHILVGQFNMRETLEEYIIKETELARQGKEAYIILKMNSLQEYNIIKLLYEASRAGVVIKLIVRGICSLVPGIDGVSENITGVSILDRYLEHSRVFMFGNDGKEKIFIGSADWMGRNLYRRVETVFPVLDGKIRKIVKDVIEIQLRDNVKARYLDFDNLNKYKVNNYDKVQSQIETYHYFNSKLSISSS